MQSEDISLINLSGAHIQGNGRENKGTLDQFPPGYSLGNWK